MYMYFIVYCRIENLPGTPGLAWLPNLPVCLAGLAGLPSCLTILSAWSGLISGLPAWPAAWSTYLFCLSAWLTCCLVHLSVLPVWPACLPGLLIWLYCFCPTVGTLWRPRVQRNPTALLWLVGCWKWTMAKKNSQPSCLIIKDDILNKDFALGNQICQLIYP
jgi:hypothetical protein